MSSARSLAILLLTIPSLGCLQDAQRQSENSFDDADVAGDTSVGITDTGVARTDSGTPVDTALTDTSAPKDAACSLGGYSPCNPLNNCGCSGTTPQCDWFWLTSEAYEPLSCRAPGTVPLGGSCASSNGCGIGASCFLWKCQKKACVTDGDCGSPTSWRCVEIFEKGGSSRSTRVCANRCDLASPSACGPSGDGCVLLSLTGVGNVTTCTKVGTKGAGEACADGSTECKPGYFCSGTCYRRCLIDADCSGGTCKAFTPPITVNGKTYGWCG